MARTMSKHQHWEELQLFDTPEPVTPTPKPRHQQYGQPVEPHIIDAIWTHYTTTFKRPGLTPQLNPQRTALITMSVNQYGIDNTKAAITGCSLSDWHMGNNPGGKKYTSIELILRDPAHIERFISYTTDHNTKGGFLDD